MTNERPLRFGIAKTEWELNFEYLGHKVIITGETGNLEKRVQLIGDSLHIEFVMNDSTESADDVIKYAISHIDEYVDDYKEEIGDLKHVRM